MYKPKVLVNPEYEDATPLGVELVAESLIEEGSKLQILLGLSKLGRTACAELQTEALTDVIMAEDQPERLAVFMFCMDELAFSPWDVTLPENKPSPLFAAVVSQSLDATTKVRAAATASRAPPFLHRSSSSAHSEPSPRASAGGNH